MDTGVKVSAFFSISMLNRLYTQISCRTVRTLITAISGPIFRTPPPPPHLRRRERGSKWICDLVFID